MGLPTPPQGAAGGVVGDVWGGVKQGGQAVGKGLGAIGKWLVDPRNSELVGTLAGTAADVYGAHKQSKRAGERLELDKERFEQEKKDSEEMARARRLQMLLQAMSGMQQGGY